MESLLIRNYEFHWGKQTYLMGILNVTPDSFSDGGEFNTIENAVNQGLKLIEQGANILDIGGQSTRPGSEEITLDEELNRVIPVIKAIRLKSDHPISIDTTRSEVVQAAIEAGADIINDISGASFDEKMLSTVAKLEVPIILMHIKGTPKTMQKLTQYNDLVGEIMQFLEQQIQQALKAGIKHSNLIIDPGIGFAKNYEQNLELIRRLKEFRQLDVPILAGLSRKSFIGYILNQNDPKQRVWGTAAACCSAIASGVDILRVHDVAPMYDVCRVADAIWRTGIEKR
ncbi:dihydropteroate synthase [Aphanothece hegewaldii CCALA 016]|uniref:Dihydropteroate synthase n=1 Tax=Aphanothece hegewaldii CCALA 016 TaxID=2107694 RepID=A0A2T1M0A4_9CHRO|nr:dihydropteroate synthase [Aphanothece hegewaldii]PSF38080.1 dihydropteroate synthase [Aphanothece hegewaldii CCALA 016]